MNDGKNNNEEIIITDHAIERIKERVGIKGKSKREKWVEDAYLYGKRVSDCKGVDRRYVDSVELYDENITPVLYQDRLCLFDSNRLVTVYPIDETYAKILRKGRERLNGNGISGWQYRCYKDLAYDCATYGCVA